jgi:type II secretory pathway pseudopilin PulG
MIAIAIIALLAALALPAFQRARKRTAAGRTLEELRLLEYAIDQYAIETGRIAGDIVTFNDVKPYLKPNSVLYSSGRDCFGQVYGPSFTVDIFPNIPASTYSYLSDVAPLEFWAPYHP